MGELTNDQLLVSAAGTVLDAGDVRLTAPLQGAFAYAPDEVIAEYAANEGTALEMPGDGVELNSSELQEYALVDLNTGLVYSTRAQWQVIDYPDDDVVDLEDPAAAAAYGSQNSLGVPGAPANWESLKAAPFESVVELPTS